MRTSTKDLVRQAVIESEKALLLSDAYNRAPASEQVRAVAEVAAAIIRKDDESRRR